MKINKAKDTIEGYNVKNKECQAAFKKYTSETKMLSSTVNEHDDVDIVVNRFMKKLEGCIAINFRKNRIKPKTNREMNKTLYDIMRSIKTKEDTASKEELKEVIKDIAEAAEDNFIKLKTEIAKLKTDQASLKSKQLWQLKKELCPKSRDAPTAMNDKYGNLITSDQALKSLVLDAYTERLKGNTIKAHLEDLEKDTKTLCEIRLITSKTNKTEPWTMNDLKEVLKQLGNNKSRDPEGHANEIFKESVAGTDLLEAVLKIMNLIKSKQTYPHILQKCNITSIHIKK